MRLNKWGSPCWGYGPFRYDWYSICSRRYSPDCKTCKVGHWVNAWWHTVGSYFHKHHYRWWFWWVNRPNSASRSRLEKIFPKTAIQDLEEASVSIARAIELAKVAERK